MADEKKKESKGSRRYNHGPKIVDDKVMSEKVDKTEPARETRGAAPESREASGTDKIPVSGERPTEPGADENDGSSLSLPEVHTREIKDLHSRHEKERRDMHTRHEGEHKAMRTRHEKEASKGSESEEN